MTQAMAMVLEDRHRYPHISSLPIVEMTVRQVSRQSMNKMGYLIYERFHYKSRW